MGKKIFLLGAALLCLALPALMADGPKGSISYKIDGQAFSFTNGRAEYHPGDEYLSLFCEKVEKVDHPGFNFTGKREITVDLTIQLARNEKAMVGTHQSNTPDEMPTYFNWYELVRDAKTKKVKDVKVFMISLDSGDQSKMFIKLKIDSFGPKGSIVTGTFSGKLFDEDGVLHSVTDGVFSVPRVDVDE